MYLVQVPGEIQAHIQLTNYQYNLPPFEKKIERKAIVRASPSGFVMPVFVRTSRPIRVVWIIEGVIKGLENHIVRPCQGP